MAYHNGVPALSHSPHMKIFYVRFQGLECSTINGTEKLSVTMFCKQLIFSPPRAWPLVGNFPVDKLYASYQEVIGAYLDITDGFSMSERQAMFHDNAEKFYAI